MTWSEEIALEHIAYRRRCGWGWDQIAFEVRCCCMEMGTSVPWTATTLDDLGEAMAEAHVAVLHKAVLGQQVAA